MKKTLSIVATALLLSSFCLTSCGGKSEANKEQIENARQDADDMIKGYKPSVGAPNSQTQPAPATAAPVAPASSKVTYDTTPVTEIIVSEEPAPQQ